MLKVGVQLVRSIKSCYSGRRGVRAFDGLCSGWVLFTLKTVGTFHHPRSLKELVWNCRKITGSVIVCRRCIIPSSFLSTVIACAHKSRFPQKACRCKLVLSIWFFVVLGCTLAVLLDLLAQVRSKQAR